MLSAEADSVAEADSETEAFLFTEAEADKDPLHEIDADANLLTSASEDTVMAADKLAAPDIVCPGSVPEASKVALAVNEADANLSTLAELAKDPLVVIEAEANFLTCPAAANDALALNDASPVS